MMKPNYSWFLVLVFFSSGALQAQDNKGGKLEVINTTAWYCDTLLWDGDAFPDHPAVDSLKPKEGDSFLVTSAQITIDWSGFPKATQFPLRTSDIALVSGDKQWKPVGIYRKGGRYNDLLSSILWPQRSADSPYFLDLVFNVPHKPLSFRLRIGEVESAIQIQPRNEEPDKPPAEFKILEASLVDEFPSAMVPNTRQADWTAILRPISGKFLKLTVQLTASAPYAENSGGLYQNNSISLHKKNIGIVIEDVGYIPALAIVSNDKAYIGGGTDARPGNRPLAQFTFLFYVPKAPSALSLFYNRTLVLKDFKLDLLPSQNRQNVRQSN